MREQTLPPRAARITVPMDYHVRIVPDDPATGYIWVTVTGCNGARVCEACLRSANDLGGLLELLAF